MPKCSILGHVTQPRPLRGYFEDHTQEGSVLHLCTKFEVDRSIYSKVTKWSKISEFGTRDPGVILWSVRRSGTTSMTVRNLKWIALFVQKL